MSCLGAEHKQRDTERQREKRKREFIGISSKNLRPDCCGMNDARVLMIVDAWI